MILYLIIKILLSYGLVVKNKLLKLKTLGHIIDFLVMTSFFCLIYFNFLNFRKTYYILFIGIFLIFIFLIFRSLNYILKNSEKIFKGINNKEKIKKILLYPAVNKFVYYFVGMLPGNISYGIYFGVMENGGYLRVGICSNRDIIFYKVFGGDSRDFFFNLNNFFGKNGLNGIKINLYDNFVRVIFRVLLIIYIIRKKIKEGKIKEYIGIRLIIYMYLSIFYLCFIFYFHLLNYYIFLILILIEILCLLFLKNIIDYINRKYIKELTLLYNEKIIGEEFMELITRFRDPLYIDVMLKFEINKYIGDKTLSNSVSLNLLYKYMIGVNENTEGYYDRKMHIRSRIHRMKFLEESSIIGDILPRTRYVIISFKYLGYINENDIIDYSGANISKEYEFINLCKNKNFYLGYYEKAYNKVSLMLILWALRMHLTYFSAGDFSILKGISIDFYNDLNNYYNKKLSAEEEFFIDLVLFIYTLDKRFFGEYGKFLNNELIFNFLFGRYKVYYFEEYFIYYNKGNLINNKLNLQIPLEFVGIKDYKIIFKIMSRILLHEEEGIVGNRNLQSILNEKDKLFKGNGKVKDGELNLAFKRFFFQKDLLDFICYDSINYNKIYTSCLKKKLKARIEVEEIIKYFLIHTNKEDKIEMLKKLEINSKEDYIKKMEIIETMWNRGMKENSDVEIILYARFLLYCLNFDSYFNFDYKVRITSVEEALKEYNFK